MPRAAILGTGHSVPERVVTNDELAQLMQTSDEWIRSRTGIQERRWVEPGTSGIDLARQASVRALDAAGVDADELDAIIYATISPEHYLPGNGVYLQHALTTRPVPALDIRAQCAGFIYALSVADAYIRAGLYRTVLVVGQEIQSAWLDATTEGRDTAVIFADGAGAVVLRATEESRGILAIDVHTDGAHADKLMIEAPGARYRPKESAAHLAARRFFPVMAGREVFRHAVARMPESVRETLAKSGLSVADLTLLIPHQANLRISQAVQKELGLRDDQVYNNIMTYGNTTSATIPIALDECVRAGRVCSGDLVVFTAFGSGFMWGSAVVRW